MSDFETKKKEALAPFLVESGAALMDCQFFENSIAFVLFNLSRLGMTKVKPNDISEILDNKKKKTAGQLVHMLKQEVKVSPGLEKKIAEALDARNLIIHRFILENVEKLGEIGSRNVLIKELKKLRSKVQLADKLLRPFNQALSESLGDLDYKNFEEEVKKNFT